MLVYVGNTEKGYWTEDVAKKHGWQVKYIKSSLHIEDQVNDILSCEGCKVIVYDIGQYATPAKEIAEVIKKIQLANQALPVMDATDINRQSDLIMHLNYQGIFTCVFCDRLADKKEELEACIAGKRTRPDMGQNFEDEVEISQKNNDIANAKTIGVVGAIKRMGTTTQAIQLVKYLIYSGYKACYIEMNEHKWVEALVEAYEDVEVDSVNGKATYRGIDMYYKMEKLPDILQQDYDYYIYDYGVYDDRGFNKISFLEKNIQISVVGVKPGEFEKTYMLIENNFYQKMAYIFNFTSEDREEQDDILELMGDKRDSTFFAKDCRDPFKLTHLELYRDILDDPEQKKEKKAKKKKGFFRRGKHE